MVFVLGELRRHLQAVEVAIVGRDLLEDNVWFARLALFGFQFSPKACAFVEIQIDIAMALRFDANASAGLSDTMASRQQRQLNPGSRRSGNRNRTEAAVSAVLHFFEFFARDLAREAGDASPTLVAVGDRPRLPWKQVRLRSVVEIRPLRQRLMKNLAGDFEQPSFAFYLSRATA